MIYDIDGKLVELVQCEKCGAMKVEGKQCACGKEEIEKEEEKYDEIPF